MCYFDAPESIIHVIFVDVSCERDLHVYLEAYTTYFILLHMLSLEYAVTGHPLWCIDSRYT